MKGGVKHYRCENMGYYGGINVFYDSDQTFDEKRIQEAYCEIQTNMCIAMYQGELYYNGKLEGVLKRDCTCMSCFCQLCQKSFIELYQNGNLTGRVQDFCCARCSICFICGQHYCCFYRRCNILDKDGNRIMSIQSRYCQAAVVVPCCSYFCCPWTYGRIIGRALRSFMPFRWKFCTTNIQPKQIVGIQMSTLVSHNPVQRDLMFTAAIFMNRFFGSALQC